MMSDTETRHACLSDTVLSGTWLHHAGVDLNHSMKHKKVGKLQRPAALHADCSHRDVRHDQQPRLPKPCVCDAASGTSGGDASAPVLSAVQPVCHSHYAGPRRCDKSEDGSL